jgi:hypothetical protein
MKLMPYRSSAEANAPSSMYFMPPSFDFRFVLLYETRTYRLKLSSSSAR